jgi:DNA-binding GntR family transcriptional regulator
MMPRKNSTEARKAVRRQGPAANLLFEQVREAILSLKLVPGSPLSRTDLQRQFGVSSTPVRDALMRLGELGLVEVFPQSRTVVSLIDVGLARQAQLLRRSIELELVHLLSSQENQEFVRTSRVLIGKQRQYARSGDLEAFNQVDLTFHKTMYEAAGAIDLWELVRRQSVHIDRIRRLHLPVGGKASQIVQDHSEIVRAIAGRDAAAAQAALRSHLSKSLAFSDELQIRFPAYFRRSNDIAAQSKTIHAELERRGHRIPIQKHIGGDA